MRRPAFAGRVHGSPLGSGQDRGARPALDRFMAAASGDGAGAAPQHAAQ